MELIARNFECFPATSPACEVLRPVLRQCAEVKFPFRISERNSNQFTFDFDAHLKSRLIACGAVEADLALPREITKEYDFVFSVGDKKVVAEVEKANWNKILYDFLKFHMYFQHGADFAALFLPKNWPHAHGEENLFEIGSIRYQQCVQFGFGTRVLFDRIALVGYEQYTVENVLLTSLVRSALIAARHRAVS